MDERALTELRDLGRRDAGLAERAAQLRALDAEAAEVRSRAEQVDAFFAAYPEEETRRAREREAARTELERRRHEAAAAAEALAAAHGDEERLHAELAAARADEHVADAEARVERAEEACAELEQGAAELTREAPRLAERAAAVAAAVPELGPAPTGLRELMQWAAQARADLFVAAGQLDTQRERAIREANELASMLLGEATYGSTVAQALARVEHSAAR